MINSDYWKKRFELLEASIYSISNQEVIDLVNEYGKANASLATEMESLYNRMAEDNKISVTSAKKILKSNELEEFKWTLEEFIEKAKENKLDGRWQSKLNNAYLKTRITRLEAMEIQIQQRIEMLASFKQKQMEDMAKTIYSEGYYKSIYNLQSGLGYGKPFESVSDNDVLKVMNTPWTLDESTFSDNIWKDKRKLVNSLRSELTQGLIKGTAFKDVAKVMAKRFGVSRNNAITLIRTEASFLNTMSYIEASNQMKIKESRFLAVLDMVTSQVCQDMDGEIIQNQDIKPGLNAPPLHPRCRSILIPNVDTLGGRVAKGETGGWYEVPKNITYHEWKKKYIS